MYEPISRTDWSARLQEIAEAHRGHPVDVDIEEPDLQLESHEHGFILDDLHFDERRGLLRVAISTTGNGDEHRVHLIEKPTALGERPASDAGIATLWVDYAEGEAFVRFPEGRQVARA